MTAVDTNILIYIHGPRDPVKQAKAAALVQSLSDGVLLWTTILPSWNVLGRAEQLLTRYSLSFWDAMVIAACLDGGVQLLYSEDFDAYSRIDGLQLANPFSSA